VAGFTGFASAMDFASTPNAYPADCCANFSECKAENWPIILEEHD